MARLLALWRRFFPVRYLSGAEAPSWVVIYRDGKRSVPLRREDAATRYRLFDGVRVVYARDAKGDLLPSVKAEVARG